jgi:hypothetical protein
MDRRTAAMGPLMAGALASSALVSPTTQRRQWIDIDALDRLTLVTWSSSAAPDRCQTSIVIAAGIVRIFEVDVGRAPAAREQREPRSTTWSVSVA